MPTTKKRAGREAIFTKLDKKPTVCKFKISMTTAKGTQLKLEAPDVLPSFMHALLRCATATMTSPDPLRKPDAKPDYAFLDKAQLELLREQILVVLADYQGTGFTTCTKCFENFDEAVTGKCPKCGADPHGFSRWENIRVEVSKRILNNLMVVAAGHGGDAGEEEA